LVFVRIVKPLRAQALLPLVVYIHGAGWLFSNAHTHVRPLKDTNAAKAAAAQAATILANAFGAAQP
jgi:acetyl esterase/lipase